MNSMAHQQVVYAGFFRRLVAFVMDSLLLSMVLMVVVVAILGTEYLDSETTMAAVGAQGWGMRVIEQGIPALWTVAFWVAWKATPGKLLMNCLVVDARTLKKAPLARLLLRYLAYFLSTLPLGLGFIWILFDRRRQGWHDKIARTVVIEQDDSLLPISALTTRGV